MSKNSDAQPIIDTVPSGAPTKVVDHDAKATATLMRKALREAFTGTRFSVRMCRGTSAGWVHVSWTDGPTEDQVRPILHAFRSLAFNSQDEVYEPQEENLVWFEGDDMPSIVRYSCRGVNTYRGTSEAAQEWAASRIAAAWPGFATARVDDICPEVDGYHFSVTGYRDRPSHWVAEFLAHTDLTGHEF